MKVGDIILAFDEDEDENRWVKTEILEISTTKAKIEDIDSDSMWQGMIWEVPIEDLDNVKLFKVIH
ncbi:hypothetical protein ES705_24548 [subsurface metagenome]